MKRRLAMYKGLGGVGTLGLEIVLSILLGLFGGRFLDARLGTAPWLMWIGFAFGIAMGVRAVQRALSMMRAASAREEREQGNPAPTYESEEDRRRRIEERRRKQEIVATESKQEEEPR
jgi:hypothetical protein